MTDTTTEHSEPGQPLGLAVDRPVRRPMDDEQDDVCPRCHGDGMYPWNDYLLPCPMCDGDDL